MKGRPPKSKKTSGDSIIIENKDGCKLTIPVTDSVYFINPSIDQSITGIFSEASRSCGVSGITITNGKSKVEIPARDFPTLSEKIDVVQIDKEAGLEEKRRITVTRQNEILYIRKPDLLSNAKWEFKSDKYITADIEDIAFLESVHSGRQSIVAKMYVIADLRVVMELGEDGLPDENTCKYAVTKVHSVHMPGEDQLRFDT